MHCKTLSSYKHLLKLLGVNDKRIETENDEDRLYNMVVTYIRLLKASHNYKDAICAELEEKVQILSQLELL